MRLRLLALCLFVSLARGAELEAPAGFETRDFGPLGGQILVPKNWHVSQGSNATNYTLLMSKDLPEPSGRYETGWRIQWVVGISKSMAAATPAKVVQYNISKKKASEHVLKECDAERLGEFSRQCLETLAPVPNKPDKKYRIIYTFFWSDEKDMLIVGTFGSPEEEWPETAKIYQVIKDFKLVDWDRFEAKQSTTKF
jgi:hypothetical protein